VKEYTAEQSAATGSPPLLQLVLIARPQQSGIADVGAACARHLASRDVHVTEVVLPDGGVPALMALGAAWRHRRELRSVDVVHVELGVLAVPTFWFAVWAGALRSDLLLVAHDVPALVSHPATGLLRTAPGYRDALAYRVLSPILDRPLLAWVRRRTATFAVLSERGRHHAEIAALLPVRLIHHGGGPPVPGPAPSLGEYVLQIGNIGPSKGLDVLLRAWEQIGADSPIPLRIVGQAPEDNWFAEIRRFSGTLRRPPQWEGWVPPERFQSLIAGAAIVVLPYLRSNPASGILVQAKIQGRAIVATRVQAVEDEVEDGVDGLLVEPGDAPALAAALQSLIASPAYRDRLGGAAAARATRDHDWSRHLAELYAGHRLPPPRGESAK
jgi:glycosyltransferase involved in cell wall biosynthesis